jgi:kinesin family protein 5
MQGSDIDDDSQKGIIPRITEQIFNSILSSPPNLEYLVKVSYMEIYMERIRDLLAPQNDNLQIHEEKSKGVYVKGLSDFYVGDQADVYNIMKQGGLARAVSSTNMNAESSRSHSIFVVQIQNRNTETGTQKLGNLYLVDLAGSEKVGKTGASGQTLEEAKKINKSLSALGMVINALTDGKSSHIPYRDSKLTRILQESLGGNSRTTLIINCSPCSYNLDETISTLRFGVRAKSIKNTARVNAELSPAELKALLKRAQADASKHQNYIAALEGEIKIWRAGGRVAESEWVEMAKIATSVGAEASGTAPTSVKSTSIAAGTPRPFTPAIEGLREMNSRPETPTAVSMDKDEREEFLRRENELSDQVAERETALKKAEEALREARDELHFYKDQEANLGKENKDMSSEINEMKLQLERVSYEHKESAITMDILKEQNTDLTQELEELRKNLQDSKRDGSAGQDDAQDPNHEEKQRKKAEKMAKMMADFNAGIVSEKEEQIRQSLAKLDQAADVKGALTQDDISTLREQILESQILVREQNERVKQAMQENDLLMTRRDEMETRLATLEAEYEELLDKTIADEENGKRTVGDVNEGAAAEFRSKLEAQYASKREAQQSEIGDLKKQIELKAREAMNLQATNESLRGANEELKRAFAVTTASVEGGKNLAETAREMERVRKTMTSQLAEFDVMKKSLMRDLQNRCEKVVELEISLDETREQYNNVVRSSNSKAQQKKMAFLERNLEQLTSVQKQLVEQNSSLKKEVAIAERKLVARNERIQSLEHHLIESQNKLTNQNRKFEDQLNAVRERLNQAKEFKNNAGVVNGVGFGLNSRIAKPLRGGGGPSQATAPTPIRGGGGAGPMPLRGNATSPSPSSSQLDPNSARSRSTWFFSSAK